MSTTMVRPQVQLHADLVRDDGQFDPAQYAVQLACFQCYYNTLSHLETSEEIAADGSRVINSVFFLPGGHGAIHAKVWLENGSVHMDVVYDALGLPVEVDIDYGSFNGSESTVQYELDEVNLTHESWALTVARLRAEILAHVTAWLLKP